MTGKPTNVRHVSHVTFERFNGFLGLPTEFEPEVPRKVLVPSLLLVVESLWSINHYFEFVLMLMFSTGFQVLVIQFLLGQVGLVSEDQMLSISRYVVVGLVVVAVILTPSTDPLTQSLLAATLLGLHLGGAWLVKLTGR